MAITEICRTLIKAGDKALVHFDLKVDGRPSVPSMSAGDLLEEVVCLAGCSGTMHHPE